MAQNFNNNNFRGINSNMMQNYARMNNGAFNNGPQMIKPVRHEKPSNLIHDNLYDDVLYEQISEHVIFADSTHRDTTYYKDPLNFRINFNPGQGTPAPHINKKFRNVKYIKLHSIVLPVYTTWIKNELTTNDFITDNALDFTKIIAIDASKNQIDLKAIVESDIGDTVTTDNIDEVITYINENYVTSALITERGNGDNDTLLVDDNRIKITRIYESSTDNDLYFNVDDNKWYLYRYDASSTLFDDPYIIIYIEELESEFVHGTNRALDTCYGITRPSKQFNSYHFYGTTFLATRIYRDHLMGELNRMTLKFYKSDGTQIILNHIDRDAVSIKDPRHPLYVNNQMQISFVVGEVEPTINQKTSFSR